MKYVFVLALALLCLMQLASANVYITEVMHSPNQMSHSDGEWVEIYNDAAEPIDLSEWTLDGADFENVTIDSKEYVIIARELLDSDDSDEDSFESYWGNNNGIWDEDFKAVDGSFSLTSEDTITLTDGVYIEEFSYDANFGGVDGKTIERVSLEEWVESEVDGTPGVGSFGEVTVEGIGEGVNIYLTVDNVVPEVLFVNVTTDDSSEEGSQVMPNIKIEKEVVVEVVVSDTNQDLQSVVLEVNNQSLNLSLESNLSDSEFLFSGSFVMEYFDLAGMYNGSIFVFDGSSNSSEGFSFEYLGVIATELNNTELYFNLGPGEASEESFELINFGNVLLDTQLSSDGLSSGDFLIDADNVEVFSGEWLGLSAPLLLDLGVFPQEVADILLRVQVPDAAQTGEYTGKVVVSSMESE
jgi:hypothetical protein